MRCDNVESVLTYLHRHGCIGTRAPLIINKNFFRAHAITD